MNKEQVNKTLTAFANNVISSAKANLKSQNKDASGRLANSLSYTLSYTNTGFTLAFLMEQYGEYQDKGVSGTKRKYNTPFKYTDKMPPPKAFDKWGIRRGIAPRTKTGQFEKRKSLDFALARSIFYKGIKPSLFFTAPFEKYWNNLPDGFVNAFAVDLERNIVEQINKK